DTVPIVKPRAIGCLMPIRL
ncbi:hypothetical protein D030_1445B, partial [Vibrio parahaemolyticus AQ3810]